MGERGLGRGPWKQIFWTRMKSGVSEWDGEAKFGRGIGERGLNLGRVTGGRRAEKQNLEWGQGARLGRKFERQSIGVGYSCQILQGLQKKNLVGERG